MQTKEETTVFYKQSTFYLEIILIALTLPAIILFNTSYNILKSEQSEIKVKATKFHDLHMKDVNKENNKLIIKLNKLKKGFQND